MPIIFSFWIPMEKKVTNLIFPALLNSDFLSLHVVKSLDSNSLCTSNVGVPKRFGSTNEVWGPGSAISTLYILISTDFQGTLDSSKMGGSCMHRWYYIMSQMKWGQLQDLIQNLEILYGFLSHMNDFYVKNFRVWRNFISTLKAILCVVSKSWRANRSKFQSLILVFIKTEALRK